ncbi:MAG: hypothetical protein GY842_19025 [bacterium]|nr:hypothetical protein [bacterium]
MDHLKDAMVDILEDSQPMTVRQIYYQMVSRGAIDKTEAAYKGIVCRLLGVMRREGRIPYDFIVDATRWQRKPETYTGLRHLLRDAQRTYRRALWNDQDVYVELWLEKEALAGVLLDVTMEWDVPLMVTRGYPSLSYVWSAAQCLASKDCPCHLYYFGDHDPSGLDIDRKLEAQLRELAPGADLTFERIAVTQGQITDLDLPTRPTKKTDSRAKGFVGGSVEVDAIPAPRLRDIARECILRHVDREALERTRAVESAEQGTLQRWLEAWDGAA